MARPPDADEFVEEKQANPAPFASGAKSSVPASATAESKANFMALRIAVVSSAVEKRWAHANAQNTNTARKAGSPASGRMSAAMQKHFALYPIAGVNWDILEDPFDSSVFPAEIVPGVTIEDARKLFPEDSFKLWSDHLSKRQLESQQRVRFVIVNRYDEFKGFSGHTQKDAEGLAWNVGICLRLIRPMQQDTSLIGGRVLTNDSLYVERFDNPEEMTVLSVQKLFRLRNRDVDRLKAVAPHFLNAIIGRSKFKVSAEFFNAGYFSTRYWQARFSLWCAALEALFTSSHRDHRGSLVAKARIKFFPRTENSNLRTGRHTI